MRKRWILAALMIFGVVGATTAYLRAEEEDEGKEVKIKFTEAPEAVQKTLTEEAHGQTIKTLDKETSKSGKVVYEADVKIDGTNYEIVVAPNGKLIHKKIDEEENEKKGKEEKEKD
jgi:hypothetical protein